MEEKSKKVFVSYSWTSQEHEERVLEWSKKLMGDGIDVTLDKWDLQEGHDVHAFMEKMVLDPTIDRVLVICDEAYATKANGRKGGVGVETQIISQEVYKKVDQNKFIPIVTQKDNDGTPYLPVYLKSRKYIDFSTTEKFFTEYEMLLRNILDKPLHVKPVLGTPPAYITENKSQSVKTSKTFEIFSENTKKYGNYSRVLSKNYLNDFVGCLSEFEISNDEETPLDEKVYESIKLLKPYRDQFIEYIKIITSLEDSNLDAHSDVHDFLGEIIKYHEPTRYISQYYSTQFDNYKFFTQELFLYLITILIQNKKYKEINLFLGEDYFHPSLNGLQKVSYIEINQSIDSLDRTRNTRLGLNRISLCADLLKDRADIQGISFDSIIETDFLLCVRGLLHGVDWAWFPRTIIYKERYSCLDIFKRAESPRNLDHLLNVLKIVDKNDFKHKWSEVIKRDDLKHYRMSYRSIPFETYMNLESIFNA